MGVLGECTWGIMGGFHLDFYTDFLVNLIQISMCPWVLAAIIKLHLECVYVPGSIYNNICLWHYIHNTVSFLPFPIFLPSFFPSLHLAAFTVTPVFTEPGPVMTAGNNRHTEETNDRSSCSNSRLGGREAEGRDAATPLVLPRTSCWVLDRDLFSEQLVGGWKDADRDEMSESLFQFLTQEKG